LWFLYCYYVTSVNAVGKLKHTLGMMCCNNDFFYIQAMTFKPVNSYLLTKLPVTIEPEQVI